MNMPPQIHPSMETPPMACAMSLEEEFGQYKAALLSLQQRVANTKHGSATEIRSALDEVKQTLDMLNVFSVQTESSRAILYMAERSTSLIERISQHCDDMTSH